MVAISVSPLPQGGACADWARRLGVREGGAEGIGNIRAIGCVPRPTHVLRGVLSSLLAHVARSTPAPPPGLTCLRPRLRCRWWVFKPTLWAVGPEQGLPSGPLFVGPPDKEGAAGGAQASLCGRLAPVQTGWPFPTPGPPQSICTGRSDLVLTGLPLSSLS